MARKKKSSKDTETDVHEKTADKTAEDAADELSETETETPEQQAEAADAEVADTAKDPDTEDSSVDSAEHEETSDIDAGADDAGDEASASDDATVSTETVEQVDILENPPVAPPEPVIIRQGGFIPIVLGGILAAVIGFGFARFVMPDAGTDSAVLAEIESKLDGQVSAVSQLGERVDALGTGTDLSDIEAAQSDTQAAISGLAERLAELESRLANIESRPATEGVQGAALAAYERDLKELQAAVDAMSESAEQLEENAQATAKATLQRAALTRVQTALDAGVSFEAALADLESLGVDVPAGLRQVASGGVSSLSDLQTSFPDVARSALVASRGVADGSDEGGLNSFLRTQLGARSLQPREGTDPDAVLSRAEAAAQQGRLNDALAEIELLPEEGRAELSDWSDKAVRRLDAVSAAQELGEKLN